MPLSLFCLLVGKPFYEARVSEIFKLAIRNILATPEKHVIVLRRHLIRITGFFFFLITLMTSAQGEVAAITDPKPTTDPWLYLYLIPSIAGSLIILRIIVFLIKEFLGYAKQKEQGMVLSELSTELKLWEEKKLESLLYAKQGSIGLIPFLSFLLGSNKDGKVQRSKSRTIFLNQLYLEMEARGKLRRLAIENRTYEQTSINKFIDIKIEKVRLQMQYQLVSIASRELPFGDKRQLDGERHVPTLLIRPPRPRYTLINSLTGHGGYVSSIAFSADGKFLASGSWDRSLRVWGVNTGRCLETFDCQSKVYSAAFSSYGNSKFLACGAGDGTIHVWNMSKGWEYFPLKNGHSQVVESIAFSPKQELLVSASWDGAIILWDVRNRRPSRPVPSRSCQYSSIAFSPDGDTLIAASWEEEVAARLFNTKTWNKQLNTEDEINAKFVAFSPNGDKLVSSNRDQKVILWNCDEWGEVKVLEDHPDDVSAVAISPDNRVIAVACLDGSVKLWNANNYTEIEILKCHSDSLSSLAFSPDGKLLALASFDGTISLWSSSVDNS